MIIHHGQVWFIPGLKGWFVQLKKLNNVIHYIKKKNKNIQISLDADKSLKKFNIRSR